MAAGPGHDSPPEAQVFTIDQYMYFYCRKMGPWHIGIGPDFAQVS